MKYKVVPNGIEGGSGPIFDIYDTRADAVHAIQACATPAAFQIVQTDPDDMDVAASTLFFAQANAACYAIRSYSVECMETYAHHFGSRYALLEALDVDTDLSHSAVAVSLRALTMALLGDGTPVAHALVYLIIRFADKEYAEGLGVALDPMEAFYRLDRDIRDRIRPVFKVWLDEL